MADWLTDFVEHTKNGEASPTVMKWVGIGTIAGALRRKVWIEERNYQYASNFYILLVGPPGTRKSTSIRLGTRILEELPGIEMGPQSATWERLVQRIDEAHHTYSVEGRDYQASCITLELDEFGNMFDPANRPMVDAFTKLYDCPDKYSKETKGNGKEYLVRPYLNIIAGATDSWMRDYFNDKLIGSGFASRVIYVNMMEVREVPHPSLIDDPGFENRKASLAERLSIIGDYAGPFKITKAAYEFSSNWYHEWKRAQREVYTETERNLYARNQAHLLKIAMVLSASKGKFPVIDLEEIMEAETMLNDIHNDVKKVFWSVGQSPVSKLAQNIVDTLTREGSMTKKLLYRKFFFRIVGIQQFDEALKSVKESGIVKETGNLADPMLKVE